MKKNALLIGNGLNRAIQDGNAWEEILGIIAEKHAVDREKVCGNMPLEFERIYINILNKNNSYKETQVKSDISQLIKDKKQEELELHQQFTGMPIENIMTCNYDYYLEKSLDEQFGKGIIESNTRELTNSLFRRIHVDGKDIWHIHGELNKPGSVCLGYSHYCAYLAKIREHLTYKNNGESLIDKFDNGKSLPQVSWPMFFFTHNIFIVGLGMSFLEIDIWWILTYRARFWLQRGENKKQNKNSIYYFYASDSGSVSEEELLLLESVGVKLCPFEVKNENWKAAYLEVAKKIKSLL